MNSTSHELFKWTYPTQAPPLKLFCSWGEFMHQLLAPCPIDIHRSYVCIASTPGSKISKVRSPWHSTPCLLCPLEEEIPTSLREKFTNQNNQCLVGGWATPLKNMSSSIGMMTATQYFWENAKFMATSHHQPECDAAQLSRPRVKPFKQRKAFQIRSKITQISLRVPWK